ncbi:ACP S-malonyltransferase [Buchnera aphidicola]|uniref:ACP S-malonyltransferase n=1 Tax=Buchnera aphidicola TaxID=9 RepID=UPI003463C555
MKFTQAIKLIKLRSGLMHTITKKYPGSTQVIIGLEKEIIKNLCFKLSKRGVVSPAAFNSKNQILISGDKNTVEKMIFLCKKLGAKKIINLNINTPVHCIFMKEISKKMFLALEKITFHPPIFPIINNVDVKCEFCSKKIKDALIRQLYNPVRWDETINVIVSYNIHSIIEVGPSKVLSNLNKKIGNILSISLYKNKNFLLNIGEKNE